MSLEKIQQLVNSLAKSVDDNQKIATPVLAAKLINAINAYPGDQTIGAMSRVIGGLADHNTTFISRAELKELYTKLYSKNTKFAELFQNELGVVEEVEKPATTINHDEGINLNSYEVADPILANALNSLFDKQLPVKMYSQTLANKAIASVASTLDSWNLKPLSLQISDGSDKFLVIQADYETPKGVTSFNVPVEIRNNTVVEASVFMGNTGPQELNHTNIKSYLRTFSGNKLKVSGSGILAALTSAASDNREISDTELALTRLNATRQGKSEFFSNQVVGLKVAEASVKEDVQLPKYDEFESFEKSFTSIYGRAAYQFGADKIKLASDHIARELIGFGHKNPQIKVIGTDNNTLFFGIALDAGKVAFTIPVKVVNGKLNKPGFMLCNGSASAFDQKAINELYVTNQTDFKVAAAASPEYGNKPSDVINNIRLAVAEGNYAKAEDALNVLANSGDEKAYASGFNVFLQGLNSEKVASTECSKMIKNSTSEHPICSHTGLPIHKVFQDKDGNCQPLYRRGMAESYEGASFINAKIFG